MNNFFDLQKCDFFVLQFVCVGFQTFSTRKNLRIYRLLDITLQKYVLCGTYKSYGITKIFSNLYTNDFYIFSFNSQVYTDRLILQPDISLYLDIFLPGSWSVLFDRIKVKKIIAVKNDTNIKKTLLIIISSELRRDFVSKIIKISSLFTVHIYEQYLLNLSKCNLDS